MKETMRKTTVFVAAVTLVSVLATPLAFGQQISDALRVSRQGVHFDARALGLGNTYSTIGNEFSAVRFNPATMALSRKFSYALTINSNAFRNSADYTGSNAVATTGSSSGSQAGIIVPFSLDSTRKLVIGLGYTKAKDYSLGYKYEGFTGSSPSFIEVLAERANPAAKDLGLSYSTFDSSGNFSGDRTILGPGLYEKGYLLDDGGLTHYSIGFSAEAAHNVFFGVSGSYNDGLYTSDLELSASDINDLYPTSTLTVPGNSQTAGFVSTDYRVVRQKRYSGWDVRFGLLYKLENFIGLSASFKVPSSHQVDEDMFVSGTSQFVGDRSVVVPETKSTSSYAFAPPVEVTVGAMMNLWILTAAAEASYLDYRDMAITSGVGELPDRTAINKRIKDELSAVLNMNAGVEFHLPFTGLTTRVGGIYQPSPYKADPARNGQKYLTAGFGVNANRQMYFDLAYAYGWRGENKDQQSGGNASAEQSITYHTVMFTMRFSP